MRSKIGHSFTGKRWVRALPLCIFHVVIFASILHAQNAEEKKALNQSDKNQSDSIPFGQMNLHIVPQSHIDLAWWWRYDPETIDVISKRTLEMAFQNMEAFPDYTFTFLQVPAIQPLESRYPDLFYKLHYYILHNEAMGSSVPNPHGGDPNDGRLKIAHGLWAEVDASLPSGESLVRQCLYGKRYFKYEFGIDVKGAWFQDAWTHPVTFPQILKKCGIDSYLFRRGRAGASDEQMFWWEAPDGSRVFAYKAVNDWEVLQREPVERQMASLSRRYGVKDFIAAVGVGNHGGGLKSRELADLRKTMSQMSVRAQFSTPEKFLKAVLEDGKFPTVKTEISPTIRGAYTTQGEIKKLHRQSETLLLSFEKFASIASQMGVAPYPQKVVNQAWEKLMLNESHDAISGTTIPPATNDAIDLYQQVIERSREGLQNAFQAISGKTDTSGTGQAIIVYNPLSWERTEPAEIDLTLDHSPGAISISGPDGKTVPVQILSRFRETGKLQLKILFVAENVPSLGYKVYHLVEEPDTEHHASSLSASNAAIENEFFMVAVDPNTGNVARIFDKVNGKDVLDRSNSGNLIQVIEDFGDSEGFLRSADGKDRTTITGTVQLQRSIRILRSA
jgi:alpha-mannosidase